MKEKEKALRYPVVEILHTFQGEGIHMGKACLLVRLWGCDQGCSWCDTPYSWHPAYRPRGIPRLYPKEIVQILHPYRDRSAFVLLTGGEPTLFNLHPLIETIHRVLDLPVHIETAGHHPLPDNVDWVTLSPKTFPKARPPLLENLKRADEIKVVVSEPEDITRSLPWVRHRRPGVPVWLHPEWSRRHDPKVIHCIVQEAMDHPEFRVGYQIHKLFDVDEYNVLLSAFSLNRPEETCTISTMVSPLGGRSDGKEKDSDV